MFKEKFNCITKYHKAIDIVKSDEGVCVCGGGGGGG